MGVEIKVDLVCDLCKKKIHCVNHSTNYEMMLFKRGSLIQSGHGDGKFQVKEPAKEYFICFDCYEKMIDESITFTNMMKI